MVAPRFVIAISNVTFDPTIAAVRCVTLSSNMETAGAASAGRVPGGGVTVGGAIVTGGDVEAGPGSAGAAEDGTGVVAVCPAQLTAVKPSRTRNCGLL